MPHTILPSWCTQVYAPFRIRIFRIRIYAPEVAEGPTYRRYGLNNSFDPVMQGEQATVDKRQTVQQQLRRIEAHLDTSRIDFH